MTTLNIQQLYLVCYGRAADKAGLDYWVDKLDKVEGDMSKIIDAFGNSDEYQDTFGELSWEELIDILYLQAFGRHANDEGLEYYLWRLETGLSTMPEIAWDIAAGAQGEDLRSLELKLKTAELLTHTINAYEEWQPSTDNHVHYAGDKATKIVRDFFANSIDNDESILAAIAQFRFVLEKLGFKVNIDDQIHIPPYEVDWIIGTEGNDELIGTDGSDFIRGSNGHDTLKGGKGDDWLLGEGGHDYMEGGPGRDLLFGGAGYDYIVPGSGSDTVDGGEGDSDLVSYWTSENAVVIDLANPENNTGDAKGDIYIEIERVAGTHYDDHLLGDSGPNRLEGGEGNDTLSGRAGNDYLKGHAGNDTIDGGRGDDTVYGGEGDDVLTGGIGNDVFRLYGVWNENALLMDYSTEDKIDIHWLFDFTAVPYSGTDYSDSNLLVASDFFDYVKLTTDRKKVQFDVDGAGTTYSFSQTIVTFNTPIPASSNINVIWWEYASGALEEIVLV